MSKQVFNATAIDKLINDSLAQSDQFKQQLAQINQRGGPSLNQSDDDYLPDSSKTWAQANDVVQKNFGASVSFDYVYKKIGQLIDNGNSTMELLQSIDPDQSNPATLGATASLINSIRACISEFTKIHQQYIKFQHMIQLEKMKLENKKQFAIFKRKLIEGKVDEGKGMTNLVEVKSGDLLKYLEFLKMQKQQESKKQ